MDRGIEFCQLCEEPLLPGDRLSPSLFNGKHVHHECGFRAIIGGANHIMGRCTCCGGREPPDPPGLTAREAAREAMRAFERREANDMLYEVARKICHEEGFDWTDPRTGVTHKAPPRA